jgi:hypothetical protein
VARFLVFLCEKTKALEAMLMHEFIDDRTEMRSTESAVISDGIDVVNRDRRPIRILIIGQQGEMGIGARLERSPK